MGQALRYAGGRRADGFKPFDDMGRWERAHIARGRALLRVDGIPDLEDDPAEWGRRWRYYRDDLLPEEIVLRPGSRPPAWWEFDCDEDPADGESEVEFLHRRGELSPDELEAIREKVVELVEYNRGRSPVPTPAGYYRSGWIPPGELHRFAAAHRLIDPASAAALGLDAEGRDLDPRGTAGRPGGALQP
jgi:hypothetical protein